MTTDDMSNEHSADVDLRMDEVAFLIADALLVWPETIWEDVQRINAAAGWSFVTPGDGDHRKLGPSLRLDAPHLRRAWDAPREIAADLWGRPPRY